MVEKSLDSSKSRRTFVLSNDRNMKKLMIGGQALLRFGSSRATNDVDYLICDESATLFSFNKAENTDYVNAGAGNDFFAEVWALEANNNGELASPLALLELKAYALVQHCQNFNFKKADDCEYDMKFLFRTFGLGLPQIVKKHVSAGEYKEIEKIFNSMRK
jgi:hypothetical protein